MSTDTQPSEQQQMDRMFEQLLQEVYETMQQEQQDVLKESDQTASLRG